MMLPTFAQTFSVGTTTVKVLSANGRRLAVGLVNNSDTDMHFRWDTGATTSDPLIGSRGSLLFNVRDLPHFGEVWVISEAAAKNLAVWEISSP